MARRRLLAFALGACLLASGCVRSPVTGNLGLVLLPDGQMSSLGAEAFEQMKGEIPESRDARIRGIVDRVVQRLVQGGGDETRGQPWEVVVFDSEEMNAFALPGGKIGVYTGILPVARTEAGLAAILGHEIGHVVARHGAQRMSVGILTQVGLIAASEVMEDSEYKAAVLAGLGVGSAVGVTLPFSRANEEEADEIGHIYMARAGYDPREAPKLWARFRDAKGGAGGPEFLSTHPADDSRIQALTDSLPVALAEYERSPRHGIGDLLIPGRAEGP